MLGGHAADQPLALAVRQRDSTSRRIDGRLAGRKHDLGHAASHEAAEVELCPPPELIELDAAELGDGLVLCQLACNQPSKHFLQSPASTSRMRCQCVPAQ